MSNEQREIIKMVADKVITVEEAERLLSALESGRRQRQAADAGGSFRKSLRSMVDELSESMESIGPMISQLVGDITREIPGALHLFHEEDLSRMETVSLIENTFPIPSGAKLTIHTDREAGRSHAEVTVYGGEEAICRVESVPGSSLRVLRKSPDQYLLLLTGAITFRVPSDLSALKVRLLGGDVSVFDLDCAVDVKTMGGNLSGRGLAGEFNLKTMGGNIVIIVPESLKADSRAVSMGGNISVSIAEGVAGMIEATTMGGEISMDETLGRVVREGEHAPRRAELELGAGGARLSVKTMGGNISLLKISHEQ